MSNAEIASSTSETTQHVADIVRLAVQHDPRQRALIVSDGECALSRELAAAYRAALPHAAHLAFEEVSPEQILAAFAALSPRDLVVLVQSRSFRLGAFRIRVELFKQGLAVIEHPHLGRVQPHEVATYVAALAYDPHYYRGVGAALKARIDQAAGAVLSSGADHQLVYGGRFLPAKLNVGDYTGMTNVGGQFPIGEVFTEPTNLEEVHGRVRIFAFGDTDFSVNVPAEPITLLIEAGRVTGTQRSTPAFDAVLAQIRSEEEAWVRELGFGMNRALTPHSRVSDVGTYERMCGVHLSLGAKHNVYAKPEFKRREAKYHIDVFAVTESVTLDGVEVFERGAWCP